MPTPGKLEVNIKINALPTNMRIIKNGWHEFMIDASGQKVSMKVRPRTWKKLQDAADQWATWVGAISGKMGQRIKDGFVLLDVSVQVYEKKPKPPKEKATDNNQSSEDGNTAPEDENQSSENVSGSPVVDTDTPTPES